MPSTPETVSPLPTPGAPPLHPGVDSEVGLPGGKSVAVRVYGRKTPGQAKPLVVHFHGGAFVSGDLDNGCTVAQLLLSAGAVVVSVAYPLAPQHPFPNAAEAGYEVLKWVFRQRTRLAGTGALVYLAGEEAGGNVAAAVSLMARDQAHPPLAGQILLSPMLDPCVGTASLRQATGSATCCKWVEGWLSYLRNPRDAEHPYAVPAGSMRLQGLPPTLVLVGPDDPMRDEAMAYVTRLQAAGLQARGEVLSAAQHWPDALLAAQAQACPCAGAVQAQFQRFFEDTRSPVPS
ncbi:MAG: alpha/beta hydrolase [Curvibacter lanceolatus]|jgi:acetyl esterase/lipase|uniref:alpha/beta hydrolase n=1 Tax=Curvibacter lanceolatus TaxID=86182 RepID=UPI002354599F|nr:alpha/beta hydrolase [Curvibacter lanceolatus]MBV5293254.1 alpha/beta hydrolase [Curvibacter lanceolatus]